MSPIKNTSLSAVFKGAAAVAVGGGALYATVHELDIGAAVVGLAAGTATFALLAEAPKYFKAFRDWSHL